MKFVEPIRDKKKIRDLRIFLKGQGNYRNYCMVFFGLNSALRISDILALKWEDVINKKDFTIKRSVTIIEQKTKKSRNVTININAANAIKLYMDNLELSQLKGFIFKSRQGMEEPIKRGMAWRIIKQACIGVGIKENIGTHTLRKTWAYHAFHGGLDISYIMNALNHSNIKDTRRYIGITQEEITNAFDQFML